MSEHDTRPWWWLWAEEFRVPVELAQKWVQCGWLQKHGQQPPIPHQLPLVDEAHS